MSSPAQVVDGQRAAGVWDPLVGQEHVVATLAEAARGAAAALRGEASGAMTHAWLFTGPPGSGRSVAARCLAAALQCPDSGCGHCDACRTVLAGTHADVDVVSTELLSLLVEETRKLVRQAALSPAGGRWQVIVLEDCDRLTERAGNVLLKSIEEPPPRTVWMLCAPSPEDVLPTIRSRCRHVLLRTPPAGAVADLLVRRDGIDPAMAQFAARAAQGHIGRARRLAVDESARLRRAEVVKLPTVLRGVGACLTAAANLVEAAVEGAKEATTELDAREAEQLGRALGEGTTGRRMAPNAAAQLRDLEKRQKKRATRLQRDAIDLALVELATMYRDVLAVQLGSSVDLINEAHRIDVDSVARASSPQDSVRRLEAILECRERIESNVPPLLAVEAMTLTLADTGSP